MPETNQNRHQALTQATQAAQEAEVKEKQPFIAPKLTFIAPKLVKQGSISDITAGFFGTFYP